MSTSDLGGSASEIDGTDHHLLSVRDLSVIARDRKGHVTPIVSDINFSIASGKVLALIGESGSGKTTISLACMGYARAGCEIGSGRVSLAGQDILQLDSIARRELRGREVSYVAQSAAASFNSALTLNRQVIETPVIKGLMSKTEATQKARQLFAELDLPDPQSIGQRYPHQVSGGQLQRLMAAMAMICEPKLLILDEPTTALDVTTQIEVLRSFKKLIRDRNTSAIYVSHDLAVVAQIADDILVLKDGLIVESGPVQQILEQPQHAYTRELIGAAHVMPSSLPVARDAAVQGPTAGVQKAPLLRVDSVTAGYGRNHKHLALREVSLDVHASRTLGVIGESGSGKTTLGRVISGLMAIKSGTVELDGIPLEGAIEERQLEIQRRIQFVFQMADVALNPRHRIEKILGRPLQFYFAMDKAQCNRRVAELLELVELPADYARRFPRELSGGERQRINLARALAAEPSLIICDEITSALDTVVAKAILALLKQLQERLGVAYLFISHDLSTIAEIGDTIAVMRDGSIVDYGPTTKVMSPPFHPYTRLLLESVPELRTNWLDELSGVPG